MRHQKRGRKLNRKAPHRKAMLANMATSLFDEERITTTLPRAKELRRTVDRLITYGKRGGLHNIRLASEIIHDRDILKKLFDTIAPAFKTREGGYCRIIRTTDRVGDCAPLCFIELVGTTEKRRAAAESAAALAQETTAKKKTAKKVSKETAEKDEKSLKAETSVKEGEEDKNAKLKDESTPKRKAPVKKKAVTEPKKDK